MGQKKPILPWFLRLSRVGQIGVLGSIASLISLLLYFVSCGPGSQQTAVENKMVNSHGGIQAGGDVNIGTVVNQTNLIIAPQLKNRVDLITTYENQPVGSMYESLFKVKVQSAEPLPKIVADIRGRTLREVDLWPTGGGISYHKSINKVPGGFTIESQPVAKDLDLKVTTDQPEKLEIRIDIAK